jgi:O-antigen ligase
MGVGANNYSLFMESYAPAGEWIYTVHNAYLLIWSESGIGAVLTFLWFLVAILRQGSQCRIAGSPLLSAIAIGCVAAVAGLMTHFLVEGFSEGAPNDALWLISALITGMYRSTISLGPAKFRKLAENA